MSLPVPPHVAEVLKGAVEVELPTPDDFLKVKETLTRIGVASRREKTLYQSCHILHKQGHYYIVHFKELFLLDGKTQQTQFDRFDRARRNAIAILLADWGLVRLVRQVDNDHGPIGLDIIPFREKREWKLVAKYEVGKKRA